MCASCCACVVLVLVLFFFFFNDTATTEIYTLSLHDALPISSRRVTGICMVAVAATGFAARSASGTARSEEHTSELQSRLHLVCRLLLEKKKTKNKIVNSQNKKEKQ